VNLPIGVQRAGVSLVNMVGESNNKLSFDIAETEETCLDTACDSAMATCLADYACTQLLYSAKACYADPDADVHACYVTELSNAPSSVSAASRALLIDVKDCVFNSECIDHFNYASTLSGFTPPGRRLAGRRLADAYKKGSAMVTMSGSVVIDGVKGMDGARTNNPEYDDALAIATGKKTVTVVSDPMSTVSVTTVGGKTTVAITPTAVGNPPPVAELPPGVDSETVVDTTTSVTVITTPTTGAPTPAESPTPMPTHFGDTSPPTPISNPAPTQYQETTTVAVTTTETVEETHHKITHAMTLGGFSHPDQFTEAHADGFKNAIASHAGVDTTQINITSVTSASRLLSTDGRQLASGGLAVSYEIHSMTEEQATAAHTAIAEVATAPASSTEFLSTLTTAFSSAGASGHTELTVTAEVPAPPAAYVTLVTRIKVTETTVTAPAAVPTPVPTPMPTMRPCTRTR